MVWKADELQRALANISRYKGSESHVSNSVHALERSSLLKIINAFNKNLIKKCF